MPLAVIPYVLNTSEFTACVPFKTKPILFCVPFNRDPELSPEKSYRSAENSSALKVIGNTRFKRAFVFQVAEEFL